MPKPHLTATPRTHDVGLTSWQIYTKMLFMVRTQIQLPEPLYKDLKEIASRQDWSLAELMRRAGEDFAQRFRYSHPTTEQAWTFPLLEPKEMNDAALQGRAEDTLLQDRV